MFHPYRGWEITARESTGLKGQEKRHATTILEASPMTSTTSLEPPGENGPVVVLAARW